MGETTVSDIAVQRDDIEDNALLQKSEWENVVWENAVLGNSAGRTHVIFTSYKCDIIKIHCVYISDVYIDEFMVQSAYLEN